MKLQVALILNKHDMWSVRDENNNRVAMFNDRSLAEQFVSLYNASQDTTELQNALRLMLDHFGMTEKEIQEYAGMWNKDAVKAIRAARAALALPA